MQIAGSKICPSCGHSDSAAAILCNYCGKELRPNIYKLVRDGANFGIALKGKVVFHDLRLAKAQEVVVIMNGT
jgi:hypothetical protein